MIAERLDERLSIRTAIDRVAPGVTTRAATLSSATLHEAAGKGRPSLG